MKKTFGEPAILNLATRSERLAEIVRTVAEIEMSLLYNLLKRTLRSWLETVSLERAIIIVQFFVNCKEMREATSVLSSTT